MKKILFITNNSTTENRSMIIKRLFFQLFIATFAFIALSGSVSTVFAQDWSRQSALPAGWNLDGVAFLSPTDGFICGEDLFLQHTTDGCSLPASLVWCIAARSARRIPSSSLRTAGRRGPVVRSHSASPGSRSASPTSRPAGWAASTGRWPTLPTAGSRGQR